MVKKRHAPHRGCGLRMATALMGSILFACGTPASANTERVPAEAAQESSTMPVESTEAENTIVASAQSAEPGANNYEAGYTILKDFAAALEAGDDAAMMGIVYLPENSILSQEDLAHALRDSDYAGMFEAGDITIEELRSTATGVSAVFRTGQDTADVTARPGENGKWYVDVPGIYIENAAILAPAEARITVNGIELDQAAARKHPSAGGRVIYTVTIPNRPLIGVTKSMFGDLEKELTPRKDTETDYTICPEPDDVLMQEVTQAIQANLNAIYTLYESGDMNMDSWRPYFSDRTTEKNIRAVQKAVNELYTWTAGSVEHLETTQILPQEHNAWVGAYNRIGANVKIETRINGSDISRTLGFFIMEKKDNGNWVFGEQYPIDNTLTDNISNRFVRQY